MTTLGGRRDHLQGSRLDPLPGDGRGPVDAQSALARIGDLREEGRGHVDVAHCAAFTSVSDGGGDGLAFVCKVSYTTLSLVHICRRKVPPYRQGHGLTSDLHLLSADRVAVGVATSIARPRVVQEVRDGDDGVRVRVGDTTSAEALVSQCLSIIPDWL